MNDWRRIRTGFSLLTTAALLVCGVVFFRLILQKAVENLSHDWILVIVSILAAILLTFIAWIIGYWLEDNDTD